MLTQQKDILMEDELLTTLEVAEWLRVEVRTIQNYRNLKENPIPFIKLPAIRYRRSAVEAWLMERENPAQVGRNTGHSVDKTSSPTQNTPEKDRALGAKSEPPGDQS